LWKNWVIQWTNVPVSRVSLELKTLPLILQLSNQKVTIGILKGLYSHSHKGAKVTSVKTKKVLTTTKTSLINNSCALQIKNYYGTIKLSPRLHADKINDTT